MIIISKNQNLPPKLVLHYPQDWDIWLCEDCNTETASIVMFPKCNKCESENTKIVQMGTSKESMENKKA